MKNLIATIKWLVGQYAANKEDCVKQDLFSAGLEGAAKGVASYGSHIKAPRVAWVKMCANNAIVDELRKMNRWECEIPFSTFSDETSEDGFDSWSFEDSLNDPDQLNPEEVLLRNEKLKEAEWIAYCTHMHCTPRQADIMAINILSDDPVSYRDLAKKWDCSKSTIQRDAKYIYKSLRAKGDYYVKHKM